MKKPIAAGLIVCMLLCLSLTTYASSEPVSRTQPTSEKEEIVYGLLENDGSVRKLTVVNIFGRGEIVDYGRYSDVQNLTSSEPIHQDDDRLTVKTDADRFSYQGDLEDTTLPWNIGILYHLDDQIISAADLAGQSGHLEIYVSVAQNDTADPIFFNSYMLQVSLSLDTAKFTEIESPGATLANAGNNRIVTHTILPGQDAEITISTQARDLSYNGLEFTALPFSIPFEIPDTQPLIKDMTSLSDAAASLSEGTASLSAGLSELSEGARALSDGSQEYADGISRLDRNSDQLVESSTQIQSALQQINAAMAAQDFSADDLEALAALPDTLRQLAAGLDDLSSGMSELQSGFSEAHLALAGAIDAIPDSEIDPSGLYAAIDGQTQLEAQLSELMRFYAAAKSVQATYAAVEGAFTGVSFSLTQMRTSIQEISQIMTGMADELALSLSSLDIAKQLTQLDDGMAQLSTDYQRFHQGLDDYTEGVHDLAGGYRTIHTGVTKFAEGVRAAKDGAAALSDGSAGLATATTELPAMIESGISDLLSQYEASEFIPTSFVSEKNKQVNAVQFVLRTDPITPDQPAETEIRPPEKLNFFQKLLKLFGLLD